MLKLLGALVALYTLYAALRGRVYAKSGPWGKVVVRDDAPAEFWSVIAVYAGLSVALMAFF